MLKRMLWLQQPEDLHRGLVLNTTASACMRPERERERGNSSIYCLVVLPRWAQSAPGYRSGVRAAMAMWSHTVMAMGDQEVEVEAVAVVIVVAWCTHWRTTMSTTMMKMKTKTGQVGLAQLVVVQEQRLLGLCSPRA